MGNLTYLVVLLGALVGAGWLEFVFRTRVLLRWQRLVLTVLPVVLVFGAWDIYAIGAAHWFFDPESVTGAAIVGLPLDEVLFFVVIPYCAILTLEAVRVSRGWQVGDERSEHAGQGGEP